MEGSEKRNEKDLEKEKPEDVLEVLLPDKNLLCRLYPHQREGILFLFNLYKNGKSKAKGSRNGAILADEMGLGKSIQVILFLHAMIMNTQEFKNALLIVPAGLLNDWKDKLKRWTPNMNVLIYHHSETERERKLRNLQKTGGIILVSYSTFIENNETLTTYEGMHFVWDCLICDEAHKLKNLDTKTHKAVALTSAGFCILITGTPMQNNLREFWSLFSLILDTYVLGTYKTFKNKFEKPITKGMEAESGPEERALGMELQKTLEKIREPFWLRRRIDQIQGLRGHPLLENIPSDQVLHLPKKNEYVIWIKLSSEQKAAYRKITADSSTPTFESFHLLTAVCTHPKLNSDIKEHEMSGVNLAESGKLTFMLALLEWFATNGNFALVFSNYIKILDIIEKSLTQTSWGRNAFLRIDGQNTTQGLRDKIVREFQKRESKNILLLTTSVGAEGLTLTAADCVVFADLSWNQSQDAQAVGRAHRIGQTKDVKTYRLITCGTLEERIYRRQKRSLTRQVVGDENNPFRFFTQDELKGILTLQETQFSSTQQQLEKQGAKYLDVTEVFGAGLNSVGAASVCGISDHGQLLSASQGEDLEVAMARMHIKETAEMCQQEIEAESHLTRQQICI
ncbi:DNA excision repair protein ERCC-6-like [Colossoma macropomum]|uniref:DNA excision repair protein ERCC-6-like n=1 Tax=Colossoma macropomum TaxID=42526 RepID=UPI001864730F|nr:DNA excision repair protein ERCC-6-like [Colossoma macropomum]